MPPVAAANEHGPKIGAPDLDTGNGPAVAPHVFHRDPDVFALKELASPARSPAAEGL
jgi:hypothetical protein